mgnify:CR=1 FL=1
MIHMTELLSNIQNQRGIIEWYSNNHNTAAGKAYGHTAYAAFVALSVSNGGGKTPTILTQQTQTAKTDKNTSQEWEQLIRYLMAANRSGIVNLCPQSTPECRAGCLGHTSGRLRYSAQQRAQYIRTLFLAKNPAFFHVVELMEIKRNARRINKKGKKAVARLNGTSDMPYETIGWYIACLKRMGLDLMFDYTANKGRTRGWVKNLPLPYHLTHSTKETDHPNEVKPGSYTVVAVKPDHPLPTKYNGYPVFDGDTSDMRFLDPEGHVALGRGKGALKNKKGDAWSFLKPQAHKHNGVLVSIIPRLNKKAAKA